MRGEILTPAKRPYRRYRRTNYAAAFLMGTGIGAIAFFGWLVIGTGLILGGLWLSWTR